MFFHNGTNYDFNLIITEVTKEFRNEMRCIPLNTNKYMSFSIPIEKEVKIVQNEQNEQKDQDEQSEPENPPKNKEKGNNI